MRYYGATILLTDDFEDSDDEESSEMLIEDIKKEVISPRNFPSGFKAELIDVKKLTKEEFDKLKEENK